MMKHPCLALALVSLLVSCSEAPSPKLMTTPKTLVVSGYLRNNQRPRAIVFVHGVLGDARATWTATNGAYFPELLLDDEAFKDFDVYVYDYPSPVFAASYSIDELADNLRLALDSAQLFDKRSEVVFVCHSMGGLITRALLLKYQALSAKVPMIYFYSTPTTGAEIAQLANLASRNAQFADMRAWKDNAYVGNLVRQWQAAQFKVKSYCAYEKLDTYGIRVVTEASATNLCNQRLDPILANHIDIVKPKDRDDLSYKALRQAFLETMAEVSNVKAATSSSAKFPTYVTAEMIKECVSRGNVCAGDSVSLSGVLIENGVIYTQPGYGTNGSAWAKFDVIPGARLLRFTVGNYALPLTPDCQDPHKTPMNVAVYVDGHEVWPMHSVARTYSETIVLPRSARTIELRGATSDGPYDCDDSVWANVRFDN